MESLPGIEIKFLTTPYDQEYNNRLSGRRACKFRALSAPRFTSNAILPYLISSNYKAAVE